MQMSKVNVKQGMLYQRRTSVANAKRPNIRSALKEHLFNKIQRKSEQERKNRLRQKFSNSHPLAF